MPKQKSKRPGFSKEGSKQVVIWFDPIDINRVDALATSLDLDRSKFIRRAVKNAIANSPS